MRRLTRLPYLAFEDPYLRGHAPAPAADSDAAAAAAAGTAALFAPPCAAGAELGAGSCGPDAQREPGEGYFD